MQRCRDTVSSIEALTRNLADLAQTTRQIESFVKVITDVSRKTKLLALNAAIEAARSGE
jgi:methyl-accepting chemotaxis protein